MSDNPNKPASTGDANEQASRQGQQQPADEEIGDYADPDAVQSDSGDNSVVADKPKPDDAAKE
jgi:hypothetical protein